MMIKQNFGASDETKHLADKLFPLLNVRVTNLNCYHATVASLAIVC